MLEIFQQDFMVPALLAGTITAVIAPVIGMFLVTRHYSFMADTLAHVSLAGVAIGLFTGIHPIVAALATSVVAALSVEQLRITRRVLGESALTLFLSGGLALAAVLLSITNDDVEELESTLFGDIEKVMPADVLFIAILGIIVLLTIIVLYKEFFTLSYDEELAIGSGVRVELLSRILVILAAVTVSLSMRIVGVLLVGALMVIPVTAAMQWRLGFKKTLFLSIGFSLFSVLTGLLVSSYFEVASGGTIVLIAIGIFLVSTLRGR